MAEPLDAMAALRLSDACLVPCRAYAIDPRATMNTRQRGPSPIADRNAARFSKPPASPLRLLPDPTVACAGSPPPGATRHRDAAPARPISSEDTADARQRGAQQAEFVYRHHDSPERAGAPGRMSLRPSTPALHISWRPGRWHRPAGRRCGPAPAIARRRRWRTTGCCAHPH